MNWLTPLNRSNGIFLALITAVWMMSAGLKDPAFAETWTDLRGTRTIEATLIGKIGNSLVLRNSSGRRAVIPMNSLNADSRIKAEKLLEDLRTDQNTRIGELVARAEGAAAAAPNPLPTPAEPPSYQAPPSNASADEFAAAIDEQIRAGHLRVLFDALPPSFKTKLSQSIEASNESSVIATYDKPNDLMHRAASAIYDKQNWFLSSPRVKAMTPEGQDLMRGPVLSLVGAIKAATNPNEFSSSAVKSLPFEQLIAKMDNAIAPYLAQAVKQLGNTELASYELGTSRGPATIVKVDDGENQWDLSLEQVEGMWVPTGFQQGFDGFVAAAQTASSTADPAQQQMAITMATAMLAPVEGAIAGLENAQTANDYHAALEAAIAPIAGPLSMVSGMGPGGRNGGFPGFGGGPPGFDPRGGFDERAAAEQGGFGSGEFGRGGFEDERARDERGQNEDEMRAMEMERGRR